MGKQNLSNAIETYLKSALKVNGQIDIRRQDLAEQFHCVPSQINYVLKTRFTIEKGYHVESKRGGGGYIHIERLYVETPIKCQNVLAILPTSMTYDEAKNIVRLLVDQRMITAKNGDLLLCMLTPNVLKISQHENEIRANMLYQYVERLQYNRLHDGGSTK